MFKKIEIDGWRQFENIDIDIHPNITILTGANGAGKTTILNLLNRHFGWSTQFIATPGRNEITGIVKYLNDIWGKLIGKNSNVNMDTFGSILYANSQTAELMIPKELYATYDIQIKNQNQVHGIHIPSHRPIFTYQRIETIPTTVRTKSDAYNTYKEELRIKHSNSYSVKTPNFVMKESLISLATFGYGNKAVKCNPDALKTYENFQEILKKLLPPKLGFIELAIEVPDVILVTKTGNFMIDAVSGGVASIIDLAWQIFMFSDSDKEFVVTLDEPENHLHPEMQRSLLRNLVAAFPKAQFIVATHNPFIIGSVQDSNVYVLNYNENNKVISTKLDLVNRAGSSSDILREVLGIPFTMPIWVEEKIESLIEKYIAKGISNENFDELRVELKELGIDKYTPEAIARIVAGGKND